MLKLGRVQVIDGAGPPAEEGFRQAVVALVRDGVVKVDGAVASDVVSGWRHAFESRIQQSAVRGTYPYRVTSLGHLRTHYTLEFFREFNSVDLYGAPIVYGTAQRLLDEGFILATAAIACSERGATVQYIHRDQPLLFPGHKVNVAIPATSLTVCFPLVETDDRVGGTEFQLGTHRGLETDEGFVPVSAKPGDCIIWDSRLLHRGLPNLGRHSRPILLLYYQRPWFFNFPNYSRDCEVKISQRSLEAVPERFRHLFDWSRKVWVPPRFEAGHGGLCTCGSGADFAACHALP